MAAAPSAEVSPEFNRAFVREVLITERLRMKALIVMSVIVLVVITSTSFLVPRRPFQGRRLL